MLQPIDKTSHKPFIPLVPQWALKIVNSFLLDKSSGNIVIGIQGGVVKGVKTEIYHRPD